MSPVLITWPSLFGMAVMATIMGFGFGMLAMWRPGPEQDPAGPFPLVLPDLPRTGPGTAFELQGRWGPPSWAQLEREAAGQTVPIATVSARRGPGRRAVSA